MRTGGAVGSVGRRDKVIVKAILSFGKNGNTKKTGAISILVMVMSMRSKTLE